MTFDEYVCQRLGGLLRFAMVITCDAELAQEVVLGVLVGAHSRWRRIAAMGLPEAELKKMIVNEYLSWRSRYRRRLPVAAAGLASIPTLSPGRANDHGYDALIGRFAALAPRQRTVIALRYFDGRSDDDIADLLDCSLSTLRGTVSRALATLQPTHPQRTGEPRMTIDTDLRQALQEIAAQAPDPSGLRVRLAGSVRAHRQRRAIVATATVLGAGAAIGIPPALVLRRSPTAPPDSTEATALLGLRPTWVPDGLVAYSREASVDGLDSKQVWRTAQEGQPLSTDSRLQDGRSAMLTLSVRRMPATASGGRSHRALLDKPNTTVAGHPAVSLPPSTLTWSIADDILATLQAARTYKDLDLQRIAESTVDDDLAVCEVAMHAGWLPPVTLEGRNVALTQGMRVRGTGQHWEQEINCLGPILIRLTNNPSVFDEPFLRQPFENTTLRGRPSRIRHLRGGSGIEEHVESRFDLPDNRFAQVKCYFPFNDPTQLRANTIRIVEQLSITANPDLHWLGHPVP